MNVERGKLTHREAIVDALLSGKTGLSSVAEPIFTHIPSGFTDNVFRADVPTIDGQKTFIVKEYLKGWHQKEKGVYETVLQQNAFLGVPQLLASGNGFVVLEYLDPNRCHPFQQEHIGLLQQWLVAKHIFFREHPEFTVDFEESPETQIYYLVEKPLTLLARLENTEFGYLSGKVVGHEKYFRNVVLTNSSLPPTLEHGDLETQNLFVEDETRLRVIDWVNARRGSGLFDINQLFETAASLGVELDFQQTTQELQGLIGMDGLADLLVQVRSVMLLNKIHYYGQKYLEGEVFSPSQQKPIQLLLQQYMEELDSIL